MNILRGSVTRAPLVRLAGRVPARQRLAQRTYAQATPSSNVGTNTPWFLGSLIVFGPLLFKLTSPPPKKAKEVEHVVPTPEPVKAAPVIQTSEKPKVQKPFVLIGGGTASYAAAKAIKEKDPLANVIIVAEEAYAPYMRPPLSKELWFSEDPNVSQTLVFKDWQGSERETIYQDISLYEVLEDASGSDTPSEKIKLLNKRVAKLNVDKRTVTLDDGSEIYYNKVLLATGGTPKKFPGVQDANVTSFRSIDDFKLLESKAKDGAHIAVVGGGFLGSELAVALAHRAEKQNIKVTQVFPEEGNMANVFPTYLTKWTTSKVRDLGVDVKSNKAIKSINSSEDGKVVLDLGDEKLSVDHVVVAIGIEPRVDLARQAGLEIDEKRAGVVVNAELEARSGVFAAGDMVSFHDVQLGRRRIEHHDHAVLSGRHAGENMVGGSKPFTHQSMFWSDLGPEIGYEAVGLVDSQLSTVSVWAKATAKDTPAVGAASEAESPRTAGLGSDVSLASAVAPVKPDFQDEKFGKGLVFYVRDQKIVGLLLFNVFGKVQEARNIINAGYTSDKIDGLLKQFDLHSESH
ncbi:apoptosis-inducing factor, mitochondrion-associated, C-term-domain-containing protein [Phycomyces nitens]|nr:apoptosis-inducing factor, mitochondrion-associated, C-term-domain-containing protein [Phycomyces nitens]